MEFENDKLGENTIVMLPVASLIPHKDNPRKDVGDITELAESIKANGILQNLTVVPGMDPGTYVVIIGHRRLAAAKAAGLETVPCVIADMTQEEQISTMLTENMQRTDLTVYEQAKAFQQLSMDLGMSVAEIADMSGFSEVTVRKRTKLAELDEKAFKKACNRGATLFDFAELDKIEDEAAKAKCLEAMGTANFKNEVKSALEIQRTKQKFEKWVSQLKSFATQIDDIEISNGNYYVNAGGESVKVNYKCNYGSWTKNDDIEKPEDADTIRYFFKVSNIQISLYKESVTNTAEEEESRRREEICEQDAAAWAQINSIEGRHKQLRRDFIMNFGAAKSNISTIMRNLSDAMLFKANRSYYSGLDAKDLCDMLEIAYDDEAKRPDEDAYSHLKSEQPERLLMVLNYWYLENCGRYASHEWKPDLQRYVICHRSNTELDMLYSFLEDLGYERSTEELQISQGTHELFYVESESPAIA